MHRSRWSRRQSYDLIRPVLVNNPENVTESIKICKIHGDLELKHIYFLPNSNHKFCKICQHINKRNSENKLKNESKYIELRKGIEIFKCEKCKYHKNRHEFYETTLKKKNIWCKICIREHTRKSNLKIKFGITEEQYNELLKKQNNKCAICNKEEDVIHHSSKSTKKMSVDHCHKTGKIRGLLCNRCNFGIGYFRDSIELLGNAIRYMENYHKESTSIPEESSTGMLERS